MPSADRQASCAATTPIGPLYVKQGNNQYEWFIYEGSVKLNLHSLPTQREAIAWMGGYEEGRNYVC